MLRHLCDHIMPIVRLAHFALGHRFPRSPGSQTQFVWPISLCPPLRPATLQPSPEHGTRNTSKRPLQTQFVWPISLCPPLRPATLQPSPEHGTRNTSKPPPNSVRLANFTLSIHQASNPPAQPGIRNTEHHRTSPQLSSFGQFHSVHPSGQQPSSPARNTELGTPANLPPKLSSFGQI
jgi:hypothetical protein